MKRNTLTSMIAMVLAAVMLLGMLPTTVQAAKSSAAIQQELNSLKEKNKSIQAQINAIQKDYDANASEIQNLVDQKNAIDQEISLLNAQIENLNAQITAYSQLIADSQDELDIARFTLNGLVLILQGIQFTLNGRRGFCRIGRSGDHAKEYHCRKKQRQYGCKGFAIHRFDLQLSFCWEYVQQPKLCTGIRHS